MYLVGAPHRHKAEAESFIRQHAGELFVTDAEALQEIIHRYHAIKRSDALEAALKSMIGLASTVFPIDKDDVLSAARVLQQAPRLAARDAIHVAIMERYSITRILSFDAHFDGWPGLTRIGRAP